MDRLYDAINARLFELSPRLAHRFARLWCLVFGHDRVIYGASRDICLDCLTIIDEHPNGRGRTR